MKISIVTVVLNNRLHVRKCVESVLSQSYKDIEYIVIDGGSTDGTVDIIRGFDNRITKWTTGRDNGIFDAMNRGITMATGEVVGFLHSDDYYDNDRVIQEVADAFVNRDVEGVYGDLVYVDKDNSRLVRYWKSTQYKKGMLKRGWMPPHPTFFIKRSVYERCGDFDTRLQISADYDLILRFFGKQRFSTYYIPRVLVRMRLGGNSNRSLRNIVRKSLEDYEATKLNGLRFGLLIVLLKNLSKLRQFFFNFSRRHFVNNDLDAKLRAGSGG